MVPPDFVVPFDYKTKRKNKGILETLDKSQRKRKNKDILETVDIEDKTKKKGKNKGIMETVDFKDKPTFGHCSNDSNLLNIVLELYIVLLPVNNLA